jgi:flagellar M-ring protein FliF
MANIDEYDTNVALQVQRSKPLSMLNYSMSAVREFIDQPGFRRAFPTLLASITAVAALVLYWGMQKPELTTLYSSLPASEKSRVLTSLKDMGVEVELDPVTGDILVPMDAYHQARISLAAQGIPEQAIDSNSELANLPIGVSRSVEGVTIRRAQELELAKSIVEISSVKSARVHLAIPEKSVFVRDQNPPTASVFVNLKNGRKLDKTQVLAITNLIAASIPNMNPNDVSIVDQFGNLLSNSPDDPDQALADSQLEYRMRLEQIYRSRIQSLVTPIVGANNVNAQVNLEIDFTRREVSQEIVDPSASATLSEQNSMNVTAKKEALGIPGAISNEPPQEATVQEAQTQAGLASNANTNEQQQFETKSTTELKNYENSKTFETVKNPSNTIIRVDAAVLVRDKKIVDPETQEVTYEPLSDDVKTQLRELISSALGLKLDRGDTLTIASQPFIEEFEGFEVNWYETPWFRATVENGLLVLLISVVALGVVRPMINKILVPTASTNSVMELYAEAETMAELATKRAAETTAVEVDEGESLDEIKAKLKPKKRSGISADLLDTANTYDDKVALVRMIVTDEAGRVANVFKQMMRDDLELLR